MLISVSFSNFASDFSSKGGASGSSLNWDSASEDTESCYKAVADLLNAFPNKWCRREGVISVKALEFIHNINIRS